MSATRKDQEMIPSTEGVKAASDFLQALGREKSLRGMVTIEFETNAEFREALLIFAEKYSSGSPLKIIEENKEYSPNEAAEILRVSRPYINKLLDQGKIPYRTVGAHRRIEAKDLLAYKADSERKSREAFEQHARIGQRLEHE